MKLQTKGTKKINKIKTYVKNKKREGGNLTENAWMEQKVQLKKTTYEKRSGEKTQELTKTWVCSLPLAAFTTFTQGVVFLSRFLSCLQAYINICTFSILTLSQKPSSPGFYSTVR